MAITNESWSLLQSLTLPERFTVCELGSQQYNFGKRQGKAYDLYCQMNAGVYESIDGNGASSITADLNFPLHPHPGQFDLVTDFGTSEHIFDIAQVWRTIHSLTKPGGIIAYEKPYKQWVGHCFYKVQKTFLTDIARANDYEIVSLEMKSQPKGDHWLGAFRKRSEQAWRNPNQSKYLSDLTVGETDTSTS